MQSKTLTILTILVLATLFSCSKSKSPNANSGADEATEHVESNTNKPHSYGGWYCPDNLNGFPAVDINNWQNVPVVNERMPTKEETRNGTSLIWVDKDKYPNAMPLDMTMPKLARYYSRNTGKEEIVIVIQAVNVSNDSVVGFRYLNGGNGSAWLHEVRFLSDDEIAAITSSRFVTIDMHIAATQEKIWEVLTHPKYAKQLEPVFDQNKTLDANWREHSVVNYKYLRPGGITSEFADNLYGNQYIQVDYAWDDEHYVQKFLLLENEQTKQTDFQITCGPYRDDFESEKSILLQWANKVQELSEQM